MATLSKKDNLALIAKVEALKPRPLNKLQRLVRQPTFTRAQPTVASFHLYYAHQGRALPAVTTLPLSDLIAMLDTNHTPGSRWAIVSKPGRGNRRGARFKNVTTVLDVVNDKLYRAHHEHGLVVFWKRLARNRAGFVEYVSGSEAYDPNAPKPLRAMGPKPPPVFTAFYGQEVQTPFSSYRRA